MSRLASCFRTCDLVNLTLKALWFLTDGLLRLRSLRLDSICLKLYQQVLLFAWLWQIQADFGRLIHTAGK